MKSYLLAAISVCSIWGLGSGCNSQTADTAAYSASDLIRNAHFEELTTPVPAEFADADKWNRSETCPPGAVLSPLTRYTFGPGEPNRGFKFYYGRACEVVKSREEEETGRKLASSISTSTSTESDFLTIVPHGSFVWWYEDGKTMQSGVFENGTLAAHGSL